MGQAILKLDILSLRRVPEHYVSSTGSWKRGNTVQRNFDGKRMAYYQRASQGQTRNNENLTTKNYTAQARRQDSGVTKNSDNLHLEYAKSCCNSDRSQAWGGGGKGGVSLSKYPSFTAV